MKLPTWFAFCQLGFFPGKHVREVCRQTDRSIGAGGNKGRGLGGRPPFIFRANWGPKGYKKFGGDRVPLFIKGSGWPGSPPYLKVWTRHWGVCCYNLQTLMFLRAFITYCPVLWYSIFLLGLTVDDSGSCKYWLASGSNESTIHVHDLSSLLGTMCVCVCVFTWWRHRLSVCATSCHLIECSETHQK